MTALLKNTIFIGRTEPSPPPFPNPNGLYGLIGADNYNPSQRHLRGMIDQVAIWNSALTDQQIIQLYNGGSGRDTSFLPTPLHLIEFNGNLTDSITGTNGSFAGSGSSSFTTGKVGQCLSLGSSSSGGRYVNTGLRFYLKIYTFSFWVNRYANISFAGIFFSYDQNSAGGSFRINSSTINQTYGPTGNINGPTINSTNTWYHIVIVKSVETNPSPSQTSWVFVNGTKTYVNWRDFIIGYKDVWY
jgi:hypothetical protein